ncbi:MAG: threonylcarbamoyl-AMP synthase [Phycisphaerales bacterium]|nr:threonylcarbamoyl-AMP synthase [Phycisphaerales bacterium]
MTEILEGPEAIVAALARLGLGEPIAFPTETVYGLGADALDEDAVERIFTLKGRPSENPLIVHVSDPEMARDLVTEWTADAQRLADAFWPGALTLVLNKSELVPDVVTAGGPTVAIRCPAHPIALGLIESLGKPIVGPSANPSGWISPTTADHVAQGFSEEDLLVIDGGPCRAGIESTVLDLTAQEPRILRPGVISHTQIARVLEKEVSYAEHTVGPESGITASPGVLGAHYQPKKSTKLVESADLSDAGVDTYVIAWSVDRVESTAHFSVLASDPEGFARGLYAALHAGDASEASEIWIERPPESTDDREGGSEADSLWSAIKERLGRACR